MFRINSTISNQSESILKINDAINIFIVGNGFDLEVGLNTSYSAFIKYIVIKIYLSLLLEDLKNIKEYIEKNKEYIDFVCKCAADKNILESNSGQLLIHVIQELVEKDDSKFVNEAELLRKKLNYSFIKDFFYLVLNKDLFNSLKSKDSLISFKNNLNKDEIKKRFETILDEDQKSRFYNCYPYYEDLFAFIDILDNRTQTSSIKQWVDVESFIEFLVTNDRDLSVRFYPNENRDKAYDSPLFVSPSLYKEYFNGIDEFSSLFEEYLKAILPKSFVNFGLISISNSRDFDNLITDVTLPYKSSLNNRSQNYLEFNNFAKQYINVDVIINYNYTYTAEAYFQVNNGKDYKNQTYHVNGEVDYNSHYKISFNKQKINHLVFGFSNSKAVELKSTLHTFEKKVLRVIKNTTPLDLEKLTSKPFNLLIYGHSCSVADGDVIGEHLKSPNLKLAVILCYDQDSLVSITNNLIEIVGQNRFDKLINNANQKTGKESLYLAVRYEF